MKSNFNTIVQLPGQEATQKSANPIKGSSYGNFSVLSRGGMGTILKTTDQNIGREVVMKIAVNSDPENEPLKRLLHEAKITAKLEHPNIIPVHEINCDQNNNVYYTMKYVQGDNLGIVISKLKEGDETYIKNFPLERLLNIFLRICDGLAFAHANGVIHRDLKPENIMIGDFGEVLIMDWGIAKVIDKNGFGLNDTTTNFTKPNCRLEDLKGASVRATTQCGDIFGTPAFMAPEQIRGENDKVDVRTDIYALGGILYCLLTHRLPVEDEDLHCLFTKVLSGDIFPPTKVNSHIPEALSAVAMKALAVSPGDRYQNVKSIQKEIRSYESGFATEAEHASRFRQLSLLINRNSFFVMIILLIATLGVVAIIQDKQKAHVSETLQAQYEENLNSFKASASSSLQGMQQIRQRINDMYPIVEQMINDGSLSESTQLLSIMADVDSGDPRVFYLQGLLLEKGQRFKNAVDAYRSALRRQPQYTAAIEAILRCETRIGAE
jgi:serine/threonine protein kinase